MLKHSRGCNLFTGKCPYHTWALGEGIETFSTIPHPQGAELRVREMNPCCVKHLREILWYLADLFEREKIFYWLDFGTLLGAVRGGRSIPHDTDGDMCLFLEDRQKVLDLEDQVRKDGIMLNLIKPTSPNDTHIKVCRSPHNFIMVDLFFWTWDAKEQIYRGDGLNIPKAFPDWWLELDKVEKVSCFDKMMQCPREPKKFLRMRFGREWRVPQNRKVHHGEAVTAHLWGFKYALDNGWKQKTVR